MRLFAATVCLGVALNAVAMAGPSACAAREIQSTSDDAVVKARVEAALNGASDLNAVDVTVDVSRGVVTLTGRVASGTEQQSLGAIVRAIPGVREVSFSLSIGPAASGGRT